MFYSYELIKKEGYSDPWHFIDQFKRTFQIYMMVVK